MNEESGYLTQQQMKAQTMSSPGMSKTMGGSSIPGHNSANRRPELDHILNPSQAGT